MTERLTGEQLAVMTMDQIHAAGEAGRVDESRTVACQIGDHAPRCKGRVILRGYTVRACGCECHAR